MERVVERIEHVNQILNNFVWGPVMLVFFLTVGLMFTVRTGGFQFFKMKMWLEKTIVACFTDKKTRKTEDKHAISQFQSLCTALAAMIGVGNISGVAIALAAGGPGAIFWMWVSSLLGMMTAYAEGVLGSVYRYRDRKGNWAGGAMLYMERGLKCRWLAVLFAVLCTLASFGIGNMSQGNEIANGLYSSFGVPKLVTAAAATLLAGLVIAGGIRRIASVTEKIVPLMAGIYILGSLTVIGANLGSLPAAVGSIFTQAFNFRAAGGGIAGFTFMTVMRCGISRGVFSNEAGLGSSVMIHAASDVSEPVVQGMWGIFEVFADTLVICTMTALVILTSGVYDYTRYAPFAGEKLPDTLLSGVALTAAAFESVFGDFGQGFIAVSVMLFAFATIVGWSYYGERCAVYLFGNRVIPFYKLVFIFLIFVGCLSSLDLVIGISDTFNGLMAIPNLTAVTLLSGQVIRRTKQYLQGNCK